MTFRFSARYGLLTYAQCGDLDGNDVMEHLGTLGAECIIGREQHATGGYHLHAFFMFERKFSSRNVRVFDVDGYHPNVVAGYGTPEAGYAYAIKDGDVVAGGLGRDDLPKEQGKGGVVTSVQYANWSHIVARETKEEFWASVRELDPRALCTQFTSLRTYAEWRYRPEPSVYKHPSNVEFDLSDVDQLSMWVQDSLRTNEGTCFSRSPLPSGGSHSLQSMIYAWFC